MKLTPMKKLSLVVFATLLTYQSALPARFTFELPAMPAMPTKSEQKAYLKKALIGAGVVTGVGATLYLTDKYTANKIAPSMDKQAALIFKSLKAMGVNAKDAAMAAVLYVGSIPGAIASTTKTTATNAKDKIQSLVTLIKGKAAKNVTKVVNAINQKIVK